MPHISLKSPNTWVLLACIIAVLGIAALAIGWASQVSWFRWVGAALIAPIIMGGLVLIIVVIPILIVANRRMRKEKADKQQ